MVNSDSKLAFISAVPYDFFRLSLVFDCYIHFLLPLLGYHARQVTQEYRHPLLQDSCKAEASVPMVPHSS